MDGLTSLCAPQFSLDNWAWLKFWNPPEGSLEDALRHLQDEYLVDRPFIVALTNKFDQNLLEMGIKTQLTPLQRREHVTGKEMCTIGAGAAGYHRNHTILYTGVAYSRVFGDGTELKSQIWGVVHPKRSPSTSLPIGLMRFSGGQQNSVKSALLVNQLTDTSVRVNLRPAFHDNGTTWKMAVYNSAVARTWARGQEHGVGGINEELTSWAIEQWLEDLKDCQSQVL